MIKICLAICLLLTFVTAFAQNKAPRIEAYSGTGLFFEGLNSDSLVPAKRRNNSRLGDVSFLGLQATFPLGNSRWLLKGGLGYGVRHYSINKYSVADFFADLFLFDAPLQQDTSSISYVRFTNRYLQLPVSVAFQITQRRHGIGAFTAGVSIRSDILLKSSAQVEFDDAYATPSTATVSAFKKLYTQNAAAYVLTIEPYIEGSFFVYKNLGLYFQLRPLSFYSSPLNTRFTAGGIDLLGSTFGIMYDFNRR